MRRKFISERHGFSFHFSANTVATLLDNNQTHTHGEKKKKS